MVTNTMAPHFRYSYRFMRLKRSKWSGHSCRRPGPSFRASPPCASRSSRWAAGQNSGFHCTYNTYTYYTYIYVYNIYCVYICIWVYLFIHTHSYLHVNTMYTYEHGIMDVRFLNKCMHECACVRACVRAGGRAWVRAYICTYVHTYIPTYIHT